MEALDDTILIDRTTDDFNYVPTLDLGRVSAVVSNPRTCYLINGGAMGMPVFDGQGKVMGIICQCIKPEKEEGGLMARLAALTSSGANSHLVLPIADVVKLVPQAKEETKKADEAEKKSGETEEETGRDQEKIGQVEEVAVFHVRVAGDELVFSAGHFITLQSGSCERLHGHSYRVAAEIWRPAGRQPVRRGFLASATP